MLNTIRLTFIRQSTHLRPPLQLEFQVKPKESRDLDWQSLKVDGAANRKPYALVLTHSSNKLFLETETSLCLLLQQLSTVDTTGDAEASAEVEALRSKITAQLELMYTWKETSWRKQRSSPTEERNSLRLGGTPLVNTGERASFLIRFKSIIRFIDSYFASPHLGYHPLVLSGVVLVLILHLAFGLSHRGCGLVLAFLRGYCKLSAKYSGGHISPSIHASIPKTLKTVLQSFDLDPRVRQFICCPRCFALYPYESPYPATCTFKSAPDSTACGAKLLMQRQLNSIAVSVPVKVYLHQDFGEWLGRLLSRPDIEEHIERSQTPIGPSSDGLVAEIMAAKAVTGFNGPDGKPFIHQKAGEYRLLFALSADGFNPFGNREAKQKASSTGIYLTCLNLPLSIRTKQENMCLVGVVPGPNKPLNTELDHFINLVVEDLLPFWNGGVRYTRTARKPNGILCLAALIAVLCDALGARQVSGFSAATSTYFCTWCFLKIQDIENFSKASWKVRTVAEHRRLALQWKEADEAKRDELVKQTGVRYTPLLKLPYFDPAKFTVVDVMHNLFLGLFKRHCRDIWGMNFAYEDGDGTTGRRSIPALPTSEAMESGRLAFLTANKRILSQCSKSVLYYLCEENNLRRAGKKHDLLRELMSSVSLLLIL